MVMYIPIESEINSDQILNPVGKLELLLKITCIISKEQSLKSLKKILYIHPVRKLFFHEKSLFSQGIYFRL